MTSDRSPTDKSHHDLPSPLELIRRHNLNLKKSLGQNLLIDTTHLTRIAAAADLTPADTVLEIGPGLGALTHHLAEKAGCVVAVELDQRLIPILREQFADQLHVSFVHGDILELCLSEIVHAHSACQTHASPLSSKYKVVANLPYYITSAFLKHMLESLTPPSLAVLLLQREVAQRLVAQPGAMSILAVSVQFYALPRILNRIPAGAFLPRPKVDSSVVRLDLRPQPAVPDVDPAHFFRLVRAGFAQRRKQLRNSLSAGMSSSKEDAELWLHSASIDPSRRAETLSLPEWGVLTRTVYGTK